MEDQDSIQQESGCSEDGVPVVFAVIIAVILTLLIILALFHPWPQYSDGDASLRKAQLEAAKAGADVQLQQQKNMFAIQTKVIESCIARGGSPAFMGGNLECKK